MNLAKPIREVSQLSGTFTLRSGAVSNTYFDKYLFESDPILLGEIAKKYAEGPQLAGKNVLIIEDVVSSGGPHWVLG